jgi:hypothetical protein
MLKRLLLALGLLAQTAHAQSIHTNSRFFSSAQFGRPFVAEMSSYLNKLEVGLGENHSEYDINPFTRVYKPFVEVHVGFSMPLFRRERYRDSTKVSAWAWSVPVHFHLWWDALESSTAPILNTDYRFAVSEFRYIRYFRSRRIRNMSVRFLPFAHESTHLGDELTIFRKSAALPLTRVNVSYEYAELAVGINDPDNSRETRRSVRVGAMQLLNPQKGWYSVSSADGDTSLFVPSRRSSEFYVQYQSQRAQGFLTGKNVLNVLSVELRNRVRYGYPSYVTTASNDTEQVALDEARTWSVNGYFGWRFYPSDNLLARGIGFYVRGYAGIPPFGQFRNIPRYSFLGFSVVLE